MGDVCEIVRECEERMEAVNGALNDEGLTTWARRADAIRELLDWLRRDLRKAGGEKWRES